MPHGLGLLGRGSGGLDGLCGGVGVGPQCMRAPSLLCSALLLLVGRGKAGRLAARLLTYLDGVAVTQGRLISSHTRLPAVDGGHGMSCLRVDRRTDWKTQKSDTLFRHLSREKMGDEDSAQLCRSP